MSGDGVPILVACSLGDSDATISMTSDDVTVYVNFELAPLLNEERSEADAMLLVSGMLGMAAELWPTWIASAIEGWQREAGG